MQLYFDIYKLLRKGAVYSRTTTWLFRAGPIVSLAAVLCAACMVPLGGVRALMSFPGDLLLVAYLLGLGRFMTVLAALDTGSAFEGMGASREVQFAALTEPALLLALISVGSATGDWSLSQMFAAVNAHAWASHGAVLAMATVALLAVLLVENSRVPFDDPNTHLELTMIHEVMVLDHSGPDLAFIEFGASVKFAIFAALLTGLVVPVRTGLAWVDASAALAGLFAVAAVAGVIESCMARLRLLRVPQMLVAASVLAGVAILVALAQGVAP